MIHGKGIVGVPLDNQLEIFDCAGVFEVVEVVESCGIEWISRAELLGWRRMGLAAGLPGACQADQQNAKKQS